MRDSEQRQFDPQAAFLAGLEWPRLLDALGQRVSTPYGRGRLAQLAPLTKLGAVRHSLALIDEMKALREAGGRLDFSGVRPLDALLERAAKQGRLEVEELAAVLSTHRCALQLCAELRPGADAARLAELADGLHPLPGLADRLAGALTPAGALNERTYPELGRLREELTQRRERIHGKLEGLLRSSKLSAVFQDHLYTLRGRRYVLPVKADFRGQLPGIVHDVSASGATLFVEPQALVEDTNSLTMAVRQFEVEVDRILRELSLAVGEAAPHLRDNLDWIAKVDLLNAQAALSEAYQGTAPRVERQGALHLKGLAHPLMLLEEARLHVATGAVSAAGAGVASEAPARAVRNDLRLEGDLRCMVVSGANTGGKTVLLKSVGLCALLVRHGMHVPALAGSRCDLFEAVCADIGDRQSLETSLSTFSAQIRLLASWLPDVGPHHLVLLDEMLTGTEPAQGAALAGAVLEALLERGATTLVTTHFGELKELAARHAGILNASMAFDPEQLRPTYRLQVGLPGASYALHIARRYGLPDELARRAEAALADRPAALDSLLVAYQEQQHRLERVETQLDRREAQLRKREAALAQGERSLADRERQVRQRERGQVSAELRVARRRIGEVIGSLQRANSLPIAGKLSQRLGELENELTGKETGRPPTTGQPAELTAMEPGTAVWLPSLLRPAVLDAVLDEGRRARVRLGSLSMEVAREDLAPLHAAEENGRPAARRGTPARGRAAATGHTAAQASQAGPPEVPFAVAGEENTLDLRGLRLDEALEQAERFFDLCTVKHISPVLVIHGHGTGRLKAGLRENLQRSPYVSAFRAGERGEGRDGVTVVALNL